MLGNVPWLAIPIYILASEVEGIDIQCMYAYDSSNKKILSGFFFRSNPSEKMQCLRNAFHQQFCLHNLAHITEDEIEEKGLLTRSQYIDKQALPLRISEL